jgi:hypothetical protein
VSEVRFRVANPDWGFYYENMNYRRSQLDAVLHAILSGPFRTARERVGADVPQQFRTRLTRLLEIDRRWGAENKDRLAQYPMAFHDALPTGTGTDIEYTSSNAFTLAVALELVRFGFKQGEVVEATGMLRPDLNRIFCISVARSEAGGRLMKNERTASTRREKGGRVGDGLVFLTLRQVEISSSLADRFKGAVTAGSTFIDSNIHYGRSNFSRFLEKSVPKEGPSIFVMELSELAARIVEILPLLPLRKRGRG